MVAQDAVTAWDLKPNRENTNKVFNVLCNVQPVEHPWSGDWYARKIDVTTWSKDQYWFEKCKWLKKCELYQYKCTNKWKGVKLVIPRYDFEEWEDPWQAIASDIQIRDEMLWSNANFTDVIVFQGYRIYMRKNDFILNPYWDYWYPDYEDPDDDSWKRYPDRETWKRYVDWWWDWNRHTCDEGDRPSNIIEDFEVDWTITNAEKEKWKISTFNTSSWRIRLYIQQVDTKTCTWDTFDWPDEAPIVLVREFEAAECNPDHFVMWYGWIWTPKQIDDVTISCIWYNWNRYAYIENAPDIFISPTDSVYIQSLWVYITWLQKPDSTMEEILSSVWLWIDWYVIPEAAELISVWWLKLPDAEKIWNEWWDFENTFVWTLYSYPEFWEIPYFAAWNNIYAINGFFAVNSEALSQCEIPKDDEDLSKIVYWNWENDWKPSTDECEPIWTHYIEKRAFIYTTPVLQATNDYVITWLTRWWSRLVYIAADWQLYVSWNWKFNWVFTKDHTLIDKARWYVTLPAWVTDVATVWSALLFLWPKTIFVASSEEALYNWQFVNGTDNEDWYYSPWSYHNDDWQFLLARRWKVLWTLKIEISYSWAVSMSFDPLTWYYVYSHMKSLSNDTDKINIDANINYRYISIYDNNDVWDHYSKLLIYDKHYNCWYRWLITNARIVHVKDNIFLWDWVYANKWRTRWRRANDTKWWEIIEIISAYVWEEWLQTPKHIQYVKTALWDHSVITYDSLWDIDTSYGWRIYRRRNNITSTRYPNLLMNKNKDKVIETYEIGEEIYWHWKLLSHNLLNEISEYRNYDKFSKTIIREMWEESDMISELAMFASIKEPINAPANVLELCISARHLDNIQFWSFYIWYYQLDADYEDVANTNIDVSDASDTTEEPETVINKWEYCEEILDGSTCDVPPAGSF